MATSKILWKCDFCVETVEITEEDIHITLNKEYTKILTLCTHCYNRY